METRPAGARPRLVTIVLPAKNEEAAIGRTLRSLPIRTLRAMGMSTEVVVLDGRSHDATADIARRWGASVVTDKEPGKGSALRNGRPLFHGDFVVMLDADGTYAPDAIPAMLRPLARGEADVVLGHRRRQPGSMTTGHFLGNKALSLFATILYGQRCRDVCTGMWAFRIDVLRALPLRSKRFGLEAELFSLVTRLDLRVKDIRVDYFARTGAAKLSFGNDGLRIVRRLMRSRFVPLLPIAANGPAAAPEQPGPRQASTVAATTEEVRS